MRTTKSARPFGGSYRELKSYMSIWVKNSPDMNYRVQETKTKILELKLCRIQVESRIVLGLLDPNTPLIPTFSTFLAEKEILLVS